MVFWEVIAKAGSSCFRTKTAVFGGRPASNWGSRRFNLFSLLNSEVGTKVHDLRRRVILRYPCVKLYGIVADVNSYQKYIPFCVRSRITGRVDCDSPGEIILADLTVGFGPLEETYTSFVELIPHERVVARISPTESSPLSELLAVWEFHPIVEPEKQHFLYRNDGRSDIKALKRVKQCNSPEMQPVTEVTFCTKFGFKNPLYSVACDFAINDSNICDKILDAFKERALHDVTTNDRGNRVN